MSRKALPGRDILALLCLRPFARAVPSPWNTFSQIFCKIPATCPSGLCSDGPFLGEHFLAKPESQYPLILLFLKALPAMGIWEIYLLISCSSLPYPLNASSMRAGTLFSSLPHPQYLEQWICVGEWKGNSPKVEAGVRRAFQVERPGGVRQEGALSIQLEWRKAGWWEEHQMAKAGRHFNVNATSPGGQQTIIAYVQSRRTNCANATRSKKLIKRTECVSNRHSTVLSSLELWGNLLGQFCVGTIHFCPQCHLI